MLPSVFLKRLIIIIYGFCLQDCTPLQTYYPNECRCMCSNEEDRDKCNEEYNLKLWNSATCTCQCREIKECTSGFGFDYNTCG